MQPELSSHFAHVFQSAAEMQIILMTAERAVNGYADKAHLRSPLRPADLQQPGRNLCVRRLSRKPRGQRPGAGSRHLTAVPPSTAQ